VDCAMASLAARAAKRTTTPSALLRRTRRYKLRRHWRFRSAKSGTTRGGQVVSSLPTSTMSTDVNHVPFLPLRWPINEQRS
jgi:hypothetical protein